MSISTINNSAFPNTRRYSFQEYSRTIDKPEQKLVSSQKVSVEVPNSKVVPSKKKLKNGNPPRVSEKVQKLISPGILLCDFPDYRPLKDTNTEERKNSQVVHPSPMCLFRADDQGDVQVLAKIQDPKTEVTNPMQQENVGQVEQEERPPSVNSQEDVLGKSLVCLTSGGEQEEFSLPTYFDPEFKKYYYTPPRMKELSDFAGDFQVKGGYEGISFGRLRTLKNLTIPNQPEQCCDIIALKKSRRQMEIENPQPGRVDALKSGFSNWLHEITQAIHNKMGDPLHTPAKEAEGRISAEKPKDSSVVEVEIVRKDKEKQPPILADVQMKLEEKMKDWHYETFMVAGEEALLSLGFSEKAAKELHLVALFYKKVPIQI